MAKLKMTHHLWLKLAFVFAAIIGARCLKNVSLEVIPRAVENGHEAKLRCHYNLENAPLYSVKWYRGNHEFYRYQPTLQPTMKVFNIPFIEVDPTTSNESQVVIRNVSFTLSGNFSCEVTADAPSFSTVTVAKKLIVVSLPKGKPVIASERDRYDPGDTLKANCSSPPSQPPTSLSFKLNNRPITSKQLDIRKGTYNGDESRQWIEVSLKIRTTHYVDGQLTLRCVAEIADIYKEYSEVQLGIGLRDPVPERVTSENSRACCPTAALLLGCLVSIHLLLR
ncbi:uncharacterized protein LOC117171815 isoform X2 [Belonocnema kinseyi]|uniref:uncharacterized protein LOC117171815 isoform X2 n=1 Tax=Belonocnema kinseyi TaxID=2817044 RepID=UPI00143DC702|nr:uncharacterized protein LOC117171815 isoform X2 [Belonocnema kinseyi]